MGFWRTSMIRGDFHLSLHISETGSLEFPFEGAKARRYQQSVLFHAVCVQISHEFLASCVIAHPEVLFKFSLRKTQDRLESTCLPDSPFCQQCFLAYVILLTLLAAVEGGGEKKVLMFTFGSFYLGILSIPSFRLR